MRLYIEGPVNKYYVQTLCMIFFPGAKFSNEEEPSAETPALWVSLQRDAVRAEESGEPRGGVYILKCGISCIENIAELREIGTGKSNDKEQ